MPLGLLMTPLGQSLQLGGLACPGGEREGTSRALQGRVVSQGASPPSQPRYRAQGHPQI